MNLTQDILKDRFIYIDGSLFYAKPIAYIKAGTRAGHKHNFKGYYRYVIVINKKSFLMARVIFLYHHGYMPENVDHINNNCTDDRIENLRAATSLQNKQNKTSRKKSTSKYLGVHYRPITNNWIAQINPGKKKHIGVFKSEIDAAIAYNEQAKIYFGEFANLNVIQKSA